jgi:hypothetical protein
MTIWVHSRHSGCTLLHVYFLDGGSGFWGVSGTLDIGVFCPEAPAQRLGRSWLALDLLYTRVSTTRGMHFCLVFIFINLCEYMHGNNVGIWLSLVPERNPNLLIHKTQRRLASQGPNTRALTSMLSLPSASGLVLGSSNAVCATLPPFTPDPSFAASLSKHSNNNLSFPVIPLK